MKNRSKKLIGLLFIIILLFTAFNAKDIARHFYPFPYRETINEYAKKQNLDPLFVAAIIKNESNFNPRAKSARGALGLMQLMPATGAWAADNVDLEHFEPNYLFDPEINIRLGTWYVKKLLNDYNNDEILMLAAYNGGEGNVNKWLSQKDWEDQNLTISEIPFPETRQFVKKVKVTYRIYKFLY